MGRISIDDMEKFSGNNSTKVPFFKLQDDGDKAIVRFAHDSLSDVEALAIHKVKVGGIDRKVSCLRGANDSTDACPFCNAGIPVSSAMYLKMLVYEPVQSGENKGLYLNKPTLQIWEKGAGFKKQIQSFINRYASGGKKLIDQIVEIERSGKKGDMKTQYMIYPVTDFDTDECPIPENPEDMEYTALGGIVMDKSYDDMNAYLDDGEFPQVKDNHENTRATRGNQEPQTARRERGEQRSEQPAEDAAPVRRRRI